MYKTVTSKLLCIAFALYLKLVVFCSLTLLKNQTQTKTVFIAFANREKKPAFKNANKQKREEKTVIWFSLMVNI